MRAIIFPLFILIASFAGNAQDEPIILMNPSFEGVPKAGDIRYPFSLQGWMDCSDEKQSPVDIHTGEEDHIFFNVTTKPFHGHSYIGLVVRDNDTWEKVSQHLNKPIIKDKCYEFSIYIARALEYQSPSPTTLRDANFTRPAKLRIWGGNSPCDKAEMLDESILIINSRWLEYNFRFEPKGNYTYIVLEAFYQTPSLFPYNGNILLDKASSIVPIPCDEEVEVAVVEEEKPKVEPVVKVNKPSPHEKNNKVKPKQDTPTVQKDKILKDLDREKLMRGQIINIDKLYFPADSSTITPESHLVLEEIYRFLIANPTVVIELGGHTNSTPSNSFCDRLSTARAKAVVDYLIKKGIPKERLFYKGYGKRRPIATNKTKLGRKKNQRVEIKILKF